MRVKELREKLAKMKKEDVIQIASEFYKLIPKAKKEDYDVDGLVNNPSVKKTKASPQKQASLAEIAVEVKAFVKDVNEGLYITPNRKIPKKERSTWRFKVKRWYKELTNLKRADKNIALQAELLLQLYETICRACHYYALPGEDPFRSVGIEQSKFYATTIKVLQESKGKLETIKQCLQLIINNPVDRYTLSSTLMAELLATYEESVDVKYKAIEIAEQLIIKNNFQEDNKRNRWKKSLDRYVSQEKNNLLAELGMKLHIALYETQEAIDFFNKYYYDRSEEVKLYVLTRILFINGLQDHVVDILETAIANGIEPRKKLIALLNETKQKGELPRYM